MGNMGNIEIIEVDETNLSKYGFLCNTNKKHLGYQAKFAWLTEQFKNGLIIRLLQVDGKTQGYIEAIPGEFAWRPIEAKGYMFIQCIYTKAKKLRQLGYASKLLKEIEEYAQEKGMKGVVTVTSEGSWLAGKSIFLKNSFKEIESYDRFNLMVHQFHKNSLPKFKINEEMLTNYKGLNIIYSAQCPYNVSVLPDLQKTAEDMDISLKLHEIKTPEMAQQVPSLYGTFVLIHNGKIFADHYISKTRFRNILTKEIK
ncbi:GNAT family N-acetyltransferase [Candidatus Lokiarchaeum ossiferum]|uniref:GNAT family N-acetyltransferase n=1 Tax=Candidatus Lokiarchaeum ossiferum TaxID=2951803 RepID=UPI00352E0DE8